RKRKSATAAGQSRKSGNCARVPSTPLSVTKRGETSTDKRKWFPVGVRPLGRAVHIIVRRLMANLLLGGERIAVVVPVTRSDQIGKRDHRVGELAPQRRRNRRAKEQDVDFDGDRGLACDRARRPEVVREAEVEFDGGTNQAEHIE